MKIYVVISGSRNTLGLVSASLKKGKKLVTQLVTDLLSIESFTDLSLQVNVFHCKMLILLEKQQVER